MILVIDSTDATRLPQVRVELTNMLAHETLREASLLVYANKQDIDGALSAAEISVALGHCFALTFYLGFSELIGWMGGGSLHGKPALFAAGFTVNLGHYNSNH